jgi:phosphatidylinositol alpha-1,6-mannosyltransferase
MVARRGLGGSVRLVPGVPWEEMPQWYAAADVFALPCRTRRFGLEPEAYGIVFLEAAASGLPIIVGDSGGAPETLTPGTSGAVADPHDRAEVAQLIVRFLEARNAEAAAAREGGHGFAGEDI